jgi:tRNA-specific 2-thiouridylase
MSKKAKGKVFVGLSGGVDSSVSAALLQKAGYEVTGVFIKVWTPDFFDCTWREDRLDAMRVCAKLKIPFVTLDLEKEYKKEVVDYMIAEYEAGRTPNPDVMCNKYIKFGGFFDWAMKQGADYVATGHYSRVVITPKDKPESSSDTDIFLLKNSSCSRQSRSQVPHKTLAYLLAGRDKNKDQSYFLWTLSQKQLTKTLFPVGDLEKPAVRKLAKKFGLETATKKDSQGLCFIGKVDMTDFLKHFIKSKPGIVLNEAGEKIGEHDGAVFYTIGQRHGLTLTENSPSDKPHYVISKDIKNNTITVSQKIVKENISAKEFILEKVNWTSDGLPDLNKIYQARIRYRGELSKCKIEELESNKSIVIYDGEVCLGGGIIE